MSRFESRWSDRCYEAGGIGENLPRSGEIGEAGGERGHREAFWEGGAELEPGQGLLAHLGQAESGGGVGR